MPKNRHLQNIVGTEHITDAAEQAIAAQAEGGATLAFKNIAVAGQSNIVADAATDTLNVAAGANVTITTNASTDTITIAATDTNTDTNTFRPVTAGGNTLGASETLAFTAGSNVTITESGGAVTIAATGGSVGGSDTELLYNDGGTENGISSLTWTDTSGSEQLKLTDESDIALFKVEQTGTGNVFEAHDQASDVNIFKIDNAGKTVIGNSPSSTVHSAFQLYVVGDTRLSRLRVGTGSNSEPGLHFEGDSDTGVRRTAADQLGFITGGSERLSVGSAGEILIGGSAAGTSGQVLTSGGSGSAVTWATASGGGSNDFDLQMIKSGVISSNDRHMLNKLPGWGSTGNSWQSRSNQDNPLFRPFIAPMTGNVTEIGINCSTADSTGTTKITVAIYNDNEGVPYQKLGSIDIPCTSTGAQYVTSGFGTISLTRGTQFWWGFCRNNTTNTVGVRSLSQGDHPWLGPWNAITHVENYQVSLRLNSSANTMPSTITPSNLQGFYNNTLMCGIKIG
tara:strand:+ start:7751 stop:9277 length:1527 start_codon:yes stop_codon:yes gene_type:complete